MVTNGLNLSYVLLRRALKPVFRLQGDFGVVDHLTARERPVCNAPSQRIASL